MTFDFENFYFWYQKRAEFYVDFKTVEEATDSIS